MSSEPSIRTSLSLKNPVCLSLDLSDPEKGLAVLEGVGRQAGMVKAGPVPFLSYGEPLLRQAERLGIPLFLDLKWHDIPNTVHDAIRSLPSSAIRMITIHALGGPSMVRAARRACELWGENRPALVAVTALTHLTDEELGLIGLSTREEAVRRLGAMALESGADGLVLSPKELLLARSLWGSAPYLVTPGIRPRDSAIAGDDQSNAASPGEAHAMGADLLVVGRPILRADSPEKALAAILRELQG